ncbi:MAG: hypothetical protein GY859_37900 [Desulfobacterales bacterium]|nr:hypothetical protein [Desulfobacterales bacterium]
MAWPRSRNTNDSDETVLTAPPAAGVARQTIVVAITGANDTSVNNREAATP